MENKKDINNKGHLEKKLQKTKDVNVFFNNPLCAFCHKKTEKLASALHIVTGLVPEGEPLRIRLRDKSLCLLSEIISLKTLPQQYKSNVYLGQNFTEQASALIGEITTLLEIARASQYISEMNTVLLIREYCSLNDLLRERYMEMITENVHFSNDFFDVPLFYEENQKTEQQKIGESDMSGIINVNTGVTNDYIKTNKRHLVATNNEIKSIPSILDKNSQKSQTYNRTENQHKIGKVRVKHHERKKAILELLQNKEKINVKDATEVIQGCSEKTLQRELLSLVKQGVLKKEGERRWSTYSLA